MTKDNLEFWNSVCRTDPAYTKQVKIGREFTAIDPMYQVMRATEAMGIVGEGWGFSVQEVLPLPTNQYCVRVRVWRGNKDNYVEQWGQAGLYIDKSQTLVEKDCLKKATTDGLTKCLSYFGFNADIFLNKFDDNKYVAEVTAEFKAAKAKTAKAELTPEQKEAAAARAADDYIFKLSLIVSQQSLDSLQSDNSQILKRFMMYDQVADKIKVATDIKLNELGVVNG